MKARRTSICLCLLAFLFFYPAPSASVEDSDPNGAKPVAPKPTEESTQTLATLGAIVETIGTLEQELKDRQKELKDAPTDNEKASIAAEIKEITKRLGELEDHFEQIATGVDITAFEPKREERFNIKEEVQELLAPIIQELKALTERPREIERLRSQVDFYQQRAPVIKEAIGSVEALLARTADKAVRQQLSELLKSLRDKEQQVSNQLSVYRYQLKERLEEKTSFWGSIQSVLLVFFRSRGRNLILAMFTFVAVFFLLRYVHVYISKLYPILQSPKRSFYLRFLDVAYHAATVLGAGLASLLVLYISGDWVLLGLALLFIFGLAWTAKQTLPRFYEQSKLLLNLGSVRENERIVYNGLPWRVQSLNIYTRLVNPELKGGSVRVRLSEIVGLSSRPYESDEPWFPCKEDDWVVLGDGTRGKVVVQTPEMVQLILLGGSRKTYPTEEFLKQTPNNISTNFRIRTTFGLDYKHQAIITNEIPEKLREVMMEQLAEAGFQKEIMNLKVEFKEAGASSLDLEILADFSGRVAKNYERLSRLLQRIAVDASNRYGWEIPFTQITLHTPHSDTVKDDVHYWNSDIR